MDNRDYRYHIDANMGVTVCIVERDSFEELVEDYTLSKLIRIIANNKARKVGLRNLYESMLRNYVRPAIEKNIGYGDARTIARCNYSKEDIFDEDFGKLLAARRMDLLIARTSLCALDNFLKDLEFIETAVSERGYNIESYIYALKGDLKELTMDPVEEETSIPDNELICGSCNI